MKRLLGHAFAVTMFGALGIIPSACADNDQSIYVEFVFSPPQNRQNGVCLYQNDPTQPRISDGTLDVAIRDTYDPWLLVGSQMIQRGDPTNTRAESNRVHINGATVRVTDANGGQISEFSTLGSTFVDPQLNNVSAYSVVKISAIDGPTAAKIGASIPPGFNGPYTQVIANIKLFGKTLGGVDLESGEFQFPIKVCKGCLLSWTDDPATPQVDCLVAAAGSAAAQTSPCYPGQDERTPCGYCLGRKVALPDGRQVSDFCNNPLQYMQ